MIITLRCMRSDRNTEHTAPREAISPRNRLIMLTVDRFDCVNFYSLLSALAAVISALIWIASISFTVTSDVCHFRECMYTYEHIECSLRRLIRRPEYLIGRHRGISRQSEGNLFGDHLISESVNVTPSSVIDASIVLCSVSLWLESVNVQSACALNGR
jgi:hypothetical protein